MTEMVRMPGVEPLSRMAWQRVESHVFSNLDRRERSGAFPMFQPRERRRPYRALVGAVAMAASASLLWLTLARDPEAAAGPAAAAVATAAPGSALASGVALATGDGSRVATTTGPVEVAVGESVLTIAAQSVVQVHGDDHSGWLIQLHGGKVGCRVAPRGDRPPFVVRAGDTTVTVVGTRFSVERTGEQARVSVQEGSVRVEREGRQVRLHAGDSWPPEPGESSAPPAANEGSPVPAVEEEGRAEDASDEPSTPPARAPGRTGMTSQGLFERAARLEARDPKAALGMYRRVGPQGPWAANALYGRARLELELGDTPRARRDLELYVRRYPQGANAADVRALLERARAADGR